MCENVLVRLVVALVLFGACTRALAYSVSKSHSDIQGVTYNTNGGSLNLVATYTGTDVVVYTIIGGSAEDLPNITVDANTPNTYVEVHIHGGNPVGRVGSVGSITRLSTCTSSVAIETLRSNGSIGNITASRLAGGVGDFSGITISLAPDGLVAPDIGSLTGSFSGDILAEDGEISALNSSIDDIGSSGTPINVRALDEIEYILGTAIYANISGPASDPYSVDINQIYSNGGPFAGSLKMRRFVSGTYGPGITVVGDVLEADVVIKEALLNTADINVPSGGLAGQIIIRAGNNVSHTWNGEVTVGTSVIEPGVSQPNLAPYYQYTHTDLGGGAIGLVPFNVNDVDCEPENDSTVCEIGTRDWDLSSGEDIRETLVIRHYGPVFEVGGALPVIVKSLTLACPYPDPCPTWDLDSVDLSDDCDVMVAPDSAGRELWISLTPVGSPATPVPFTQAYSYRVTPRTYVQDMVTYTYLRSDGTGLTTAPNVYPYTYEFTVMCSPP